MYRIGSVQFNTRDEADAWADTNVGGTYSIIPLAFCRTCGDWEDDGERCDVCGARKADDGDFYGGCKALARTGLPYYKMQPTHPLYQLRSWVFGIAIH